MNDFDPVNSPLGEHVVQPEDKAQQKRIFSLNLERDLQKAESELKKRRSDELSTRMDAIGLKASAVGLGLVGVLFAPLTLFLGPLIDHFMSHDDDLRLNEKNTNHEDSSGLDQKIPLQKEGSPKYTEYLKAGILGFFLLAADQWKNADEKLQNAKDETVRLATQINQLISTKIQNIEEVAAEKIQELEVETNQKLNQLEVVINKDTLLSIDSAKNFIDSEDEEEKMARGEVKGWQLEGLASQKNEKISNLASAKEAKIKKIVSDKDKQISEMQLRKTQLDDEFFDANSLKSRDIKQIDDR